jgi:hypothetical protein
MRTYLGQQNGVQNPSLLVHQLNIDLSGPKVMFSAIPLTIWMRYCIFNTGNWDSRIYTYEKYLLTV